MAYSNNERIELDNGNIYEGECLNGKFNGKGKITYVTGDYFVGDFVDGDCHGKGIMTYADGEVTEGYWIKNIYIGKNEGLFLYEDMVIEEYKENIENCKRKLELEIEEYNLSNGEEKTIIFILKDLDRIIKARGIEVFEKLNIEESIIINAIKDSKNYDIEIINKMFETLGIKERI